jgi:hypothetical protein
MRKKEKFFDYEKDHPKKLEYHVSCDTIEWYGEYECQAFQSTTNSLIYKIIVPETGDSFYVKVQDPETASEKLKEEVSKYTGWMVGDLLPWDYLVHDDCEIIHGTPPPRKGHDKHDQTEGKI